VEESVHLPVIFTLLTRIPCNDYCLVNQALYLVGERHMPHSTLIIIIVIITVIITHTTLFHHMCGCKENIKHT